MTIAACLLLYSIAVLIGGPPLLRRLTGRGHAPRLGVAAWLTAIASVLVSWTAATASAIFDIAHHWVHPGAAIAACLTMLRGLAAGNAGTALQVGLFVLVGRAERLAIATDVRRGRTALIAAVIAFAAGGPLVTMLLAVSGVLICGF